MKAQMRSVLIEVAKTLNSANIQWAVGGSLMLHSLDIVDEVHDIDILVSLEDIKTTISLLETIGEQVPVPNKSEYVTRHFYTFNIDGIDMDVMSGFRIKHNEGIYEFPFDKHSIVNTQQIEGMSIPYTSLEDWYVAYMLMIGREWKVDLILNYLDVNGCKHPELLTRTLKQNLPIDIKKAITTLQ